ncbi:GNAT family N-acetyltransferase [Nocardia neocaledoniensis NBRC 108232]|uniref:Acetyltransferase (GNAT) family protein n=1 Tax=Nocardia neocaledoniensis TaxID=236511 RepID=A0A317N1W7_9NOCA|nr:GNAT family N-acetyltransferase [Nocardia neocaledoniensis]PWV66926.1 acetyltransferase (GNAT) family protein [Nocardia neocaledoniensis]GEM32042.1 GNAT family N-acetyltransferase [Nocardia neocaledoniensis NBRC 108232]
MITIRPRTADDLPACVAALREVHSADGYPAVWPEDPVAWLSPVEQIDARVAESNHTVVPSHRRLDVGRRLLAAAVNMAGRRGGRAVLSVEAGGTAALSLYDSAGWKKIHSGPGGWTTPDGRPALLHYLLSPSR